MATVALSHRDSLRRFAIVGVAGCVLQVTLFALFANGFGWEPRVATVFATSCGYIQSFVLHRTWSFEARDGVIGRQAPRFVVVSAVAVGVNVLVLSILLHIFEWPNLLSEAVAIGPQALLSYIGNRTWSFAV
ncbi:MAG TPA: GtrA family protein [Baekduia sp.]|nr:GtrA family protein [Baekduia sp.]